MAFAKSTIAVQILGDSSDLERAFRRANLGAQGFARHLLRVAAGVVSIGAAAAAVKKIADAGIRAEEETGKLNQAFELQGRNAKALEPAVARLEKANRKLGFTNSDTRQSLISLVTAGDDVAAATKDMGLAMDLARVKNISLSEATMVLVRSHAGNLRALKGLGISIVPVTKNMEKLRAAHKKSGTALTQHDKQLAKSADVAATYELVTKRLSKAVGGQAEEYAKTAAGGMARYHASMENIQEQLGKKILPAIVKMIEFLNDLADIFTGTGSAGDKFKAVLERVGLSAETSARILNDLKQTFEKLKTVVVTVFNIMEPIVRAFFSLLKADIQFIDDLIHGRWAKVWGDAAQIFVKAWGLIKTVAIAQIKILGAVAEKIGSAILHGIERGLKALGAALIRLIVGPINAVIDRLNSLDFLGVIPNIPHIGGSGGGGAGRSVPTGPAGPAGPQPRPAGTLLGPTRTTQGIAFHGATINVYGVQDADALVREIQKKARRQAASRAGPFGGHNLGLA